MTDAEIIKAMDESRFVKKRELPGTDGIVSYNYDKKAFWKGMWDDATIHARGLFIRNGKVVARSFDKFFRINEQPASSLDEIKRMIQRPDLVNVRLVRKYNGYLGVCSWDAERGEWFIASKSSNVGAYADTFRRALEQSGFIVRMNSLPRDQISGYSFVFEVFDYERDPHFMLWSRGVNCQLIAVFQNNLHNDGLSFEEIKSRFCLKDADIPFWSAGQKDFAELINHLKSFVNERFFEEGRVVQFEYEDGSVFRVKVKTAWYSFWKYVRGRLMKTWGDMAHPQIPCYTGNERELIGRTAWMDQAVDFVNSLTWDTLEGYKTLDMFGNKHMNMVKVIEDHIDFSRFLHMKGVCLNGD